MTSVDISSIFVSPNRQRKVFDETALTTLAVSIKELGLLQPLVVREEQGKLTLVAGERRLRACKMLGLKTVPIVSLGELDELSRERAELEENIVREDLTWQERSSALARLHKLRSGEQAQIGQTQTLAATSNEVFGYAGAGAEKVRHAVMLQEFLGDPDVQSAKTETEAVNIVRKKMTELFSGELAKRVKVEATPHNLLSGDCREILPTLPAGFFDCIITDPPYGIDADKMSPLSGSEAGTSHDYVDDAETAQSIWRAIFVEGYRITKPDAALYMFYDFRWDKILRSLADHAGWTVWATPLIWHKPTGGMLGDSTHGPRKSYECILFAYKGDKRTTGLFLDVIIENPQGAKLHAAAKPVSVITNLLHRSCIPGAQVIDPCCGSGTIFPAANGLMLKATGIELVEKHLATAKTRLSENPGV